jgi:hypothetical protein
VPTELDCRWKEAVLAQFELLFQNLPGGTEEHHKNPQSELQVSEPRGFVIVGVEPSASATVGRLYYDRLLK